MASLVHGNHKSFSIIIKEDDLYPALLNILVTSSTPLSPQQVIKRLGDVLGEVKIKYGFETPEITDEIAVDLLNRGLRKQDFVYEDGVLKLRGKRENYVFPVTNQLIN